MASVRITLVNYWRLWDVHFQLLSDGWRWLCAHSSLSFYEILVSKATDLKMAMWILNLDPIIHPSSHWKDWCWRWNSSILVIWCQQLTHCKNPRWRKRLRAEGEEGIRGWDGWMASPIQWTWTWQTPGDGEGQEGLGCCSTWGRKESDTTGQLENNNVTCIAQQILLVLSCLSTVLWLTAHVSDVPDTSLHIC